jgi:hypothetical protein
MPKTWQKISVVYDLVCNGFFLLTVIKTWIENFEESGVVSFFHLIKFNFLQDGTRSDVVLHLCRKFGQGR